jgi:alpha/beta superfamily hydrolase
VPRPDAEQSRSLSPMPAPLHLVTDDGLTLEGDLAPAPSGEERCGMVLCHPHPQYGGTMRSLVISALFDALPPLGVTCLRFNFRGVEGSEGVYDAGNLERVDVEAAVAALSDRIPAATPLVLTGWSFGGDMALSVRQARVAAWVAIAPPLRWAHDLDGLATDPRPKLLVLGQHDEVKDPAEVREVAHRWANTDVQIVGGASHFFVGRTERLVELAADSVERIAPAGGATPSS